MTSSENRRIGYARVSTADQDPRLQIDAVTAAGCHRVYTDHASGGITDRPQLASAMDYLRPGDTLVVWKLDRLGRSVQHLLATLNDLSARGIGFVSLTEGMDTTTPGGRLIYTVLAAIAEFERDLIRERTMAGLVAARAQGRVGGRKPALNADQITMAVHAIDGGTPLATVAANLGVGQSTLYRHVRERRSARP